MLDTFEGAVSRSRLQRRRCGQTATACTGEHSRRLDHKVSEALVGKGVIQSRTDKFTCSIKQIVTLFKAKLRGMKHAPTMFVGTQCLETSGAKLERRSAPALKEMRLTINAEEKAYVPKSH
jgi:hypothetical protein